MALVGKDQLVHEVAERSGLGVEEARHALEEMLTAIEAQLGKGNEVRLTGFGKFSVSRRKAREGRNPQTGEPMKIAAKKVPHFSAGAELKKAVPPAPQEGASRSSSKRRRAPGRAGSRSAETSPGDEEAGRSERNRAKGTRRGPRTARKPTTRKRRAPRDDEAAAGSRDAAEGQSAGSRAAGKAVSVAASGAKFAVVVAAGLAAGVAGGLAVTHRR